MRFSVLWLAKKAGVCYTKRNTTRRGGGMADALVSGTSGGNFMWVQIPSSAPS